MTIVIFLCPSTVNLFILFTEGRKVTLPMNRRVFLKTAGSVPLLATGLVPRLQSAGDERVIEGIRLCWCPPGRFVMGSPVAEIDRRYDEGPVHVTLTKGFWTGKFEVTQGQWQ